MLLQRFIFLNMKAPLLQFQILQISFIVCNPIRRLSMYLQIWKAWLQIITALALLAKEKRQSRRLQGIRVLGVVPESENPILFVHVFWKLECERP